MSPLLVGVVLSQALILMVGVLDLLPSDDILHSFPVEEQNISPSKQETRQSRTGQNEKRTLAYTD